MKKIIVFMLLSISLTSCNGCSKSGKMRRQEKENSSRNGFFNNRLQNVISMKVENGVFKIPIIINNIKMDFIFDTGASEIIISETEALFMYKQGTLQKDDILSSQEFQIADGSISNGTLINLRRVKIGNRILKNVKAAVVHNLDAPLLLGQSALAQFGKVSIDYKKNEITFE